LVIDGRRQGKAGAGALAVLVEDLLIPGRLHRFPKLLQRRTVGPVAQVGNIGRGIGLPWKLWHGLFLLFWYGSFIRT